jgi:hypothetical protein
MEKKTSEELYPPSSSAVSCSTIFNDYFLPGCPPCRSSMERGNWCCSSPGMVSPGNRTINRALYVVDPSPPPHPQKIVKPRNLSRALRRHRRGYTSWTKELLRDKNPKCRLYLCLIEFIDWRYSQSCWYFWPLLWTVAPLTSLWFTSPIPFPLPKVKVQFIQTVCGWERVGGVELCWRPYFAGV